MTNSIVAQADGLEALTSRETLQMTSKEIAELVEKRHDNVKRTIETLAERGVIAQPPIKNMTFVDASGRDRQTSVYVFSGDQGRKSSYIVVAQIAPQAIGPIVDRWGKTESTLQELLSALEAFDIPDDLPPDMFVYAIRERETGRIKLGISRDPSSRVAQLQTGNSSKLELVAVRPAVNRFADERVIHADAASYRLRGEWFTASALEVLKDRLEPGSYHLRPTSPKQSPLLNPIARQADRIGQH